MKQPSVGLPAGKGRTPASTRPRRNIWWGILCTAAGWAFFAIPFFFGAGMLAMTSYYATRSEENGGPDPANPFLIFGLIVALLAMILAPIAGGMAVVNRLRSHWIAAAILAVPGLIVFGTICSL